MSRCKNFTITSHHITRVPYSWDRSAPTLGILMKLSQHAHHLPTAGHEKETKVTYPLATACTWIPAIVQAPLSQGLLLAIKEKSKSSGDRIFKHRGARLAHTHVAPPNRVQCSARRAETDCNHHAMSIISGGGHPSSIITPSRSRQQQQQGCV